MDDYGLQNAYLNFAGNLASSAMNYAAASSIDKQTRKYNTRMYEKQLADNRENWRMSNEYNSPVQQIQRLREAGLNPNLVYGSKTAQGNTSGPAAGASPQSWNRHVPNIDFGNFGSDLMAGTLQKYQIDSIKAQIEKTNAEKARIIADIPGVDATSKQRIFDYAMSEMYGEEKIKTQLDLLENRLKIGNSDAVIKENEALISDWLYKDTDIGKGLVGMRFLLSVAQYKSIMADIDKVPYEIAQLKAGVNESAARVHLMKTQESLNKAREYLTYKEANSVDAGIARTQADTDRIRQVTRSGEHALEMDEANDRFYLEHPNYNTTIHVLDDVTSLIGNALGGASKGVSVAKSIKNF